MCCGLTPPQHQHQLKDWKHHMHIHLLIDPSSSRKKKKLRMDGQISLTDARFLRSLSPLRGYFSYAPLHIDICSPAILGGSNVQGTNIDKLVQVQPHTSTIMDSEYRDVTKDGPVEVMMMWECPEIIWWRVNQTCIIKVTMKEQANKLLEDAPSASTRLFPDFIFDQATSLHVYDNSSITIIPLQLGWQNLRWCRVERCPRLHTVFTLPHGGHGNNFYCLLTFWASQLLSARYIWDFYTRDMAYDYFTNLKFLHLDHCPRLVHVLPLPILETNDAFHALETLEIVYCGELKEVFPLVDPELQEQDKIIVFSMLKRINLHELPMLKRICGRRISAPNLTTVKSRGCWSLRRLPAVERYTKVDCEKEWWDNLELDGLEKKHHPSLYEASHSLYYKAQLPGVSVLR